MLSPKVYDSLNEMDRCMIMGRSGTLYIGDICMNDLTLLQLKRLDDIRLEIHNRIQSKGNFPVISNDTLQRWSDDTLQRWSDELLDIRNCITAIA